MEDAVEPSYLQGINSLFIMCIGIIRNNSFVDGRARAESNPGHWACHALLHMAAECFNHSATKAGRSPISVPLKNFTSKTWGHIRLTQKWQVCDLSVSLMKPNRRRKVKEVDYLRRRLRRCRSMCSLSWMRTCRSVGWSLMNGCLRSCSVLGRIV